MNIPMDIKTLVKKLELTVSLTQVENIETLRAEAQAIQSAFRSLKRSQIPANEFVSLKFRMQHTRQHILALVLKFLESTPKNISPTQAVAACQTLSLLELKPSARDLKRVAQALALASPLCAQEVRSAAHTLFATYNEHSLISPEDSEALRLAGPSRLLPIEANAPSRCTFEKWSQWKDLGDYQYEGEGVRYRGLHFLPGDGLVCSVNRDGNGVYTALCNPRSYGYHMGFFAIITVEGTRFPVVLETYKLGVRAVPLCSFLRENVCSYVEVYRLKHPPQDFFERLNQEAAKLPSAIRGYNFDTEDPDRSYISCTTVGTHLYELAGGPTIRAKSRFFTEPTILRNLETFDFVLPAFLSMNDYMTDDQMECVGAVDNGHLEANLTREIAERHFVDIFRNGVLDLSLLPVMFALNRFGVREMRKGGFLGRLIGLPYGLTKDNLPKGPEKVLAVIEVYEHRIAAAVKKTRATVRAHFDLSKLVDVDMLNKDSAVVARIDAALSGIARGFPAEGEQAREELRA